MIPKWKGRIFVRERQIAIAYNTNAGNNQILC